MSIHASLSSAAADALPGEEASPKWIFSYPNLADFNFNYHRLLEGAGQTGIGVIGVIGEVKVAVVGAGIAGLTAARELFRCGVTHIDIYEASERIGGRNYSQAVPGQETVLEMGAMRMPFFRTPGEGGSVLDYYRGLFDIRTAPFPNPHAESVVNTGIWVNDGYGPDPEKPFAEPKLLTWESNSEMPPDKLLQGITKKWKRFEAFFTAEDGPVVTAYNKGGEDWRKLWQAIVSNYWKLNFRDLVNMCAIKRYDPSDPGNFGGLGMTAAEAQAFYTIGAGDGSWGAFYDISCLFPIRTLLFGFGLHHQLIEGLDPAQPAFVSEEHQGELTDSAGNTLAPPLYRGIQTFSECLFFKPVKSSQVDPVSLFEAMGDPRYSVNLFTQAPVTRLASDDNDGINLTSLQGEQHYDVVIATPSTWALQMSCDLRFPPDRLPIAVKQSINSSHWISSTKIFYPLKERYWEKSKIPQVIATDTYLQDVYGYAAGKDPGVLLLSYTWEDDANKLDSETDDDELAQRALGTLDEITMVGSGERISTYVDKSSPTVFRWSREPTYHGCAKLYRQRSWAMDYALLANNQDLGKKSGLYFAGEGYSVEGGWTEPALRLALDAVIHILNDHGARFLNGFSFSDYPRYDTAFRPPR
jgi:tryptophan 2-monooxygenase